MFSSKKNITSHHTVNCGKISQSQHKTSRIFKNVYVALSGLCKPAQRHINIFENSGCLMLDASSEGSVCAPWRGCHSFSYHTSGGYGSCWCLKTATHNHLKHTPAHYDIALRSANLLLNALMTTACDPGPGLYAPNPRQSHLPFV